MQDYRIIIYSCFFFLTLKNLKLEITKSGQEIIFECDG